MAYSLKWKPEAKKEFKGLDKAIQQQAFSQFKKLVNSPELGEHLGDRAGFNPSQKSRGFNPRDEYIVLSAQEEAQGFSPRSFTLTGYRKLYFFQKKYRIVYELDQKNNEVTIYAVGKRENMKIYQDLARRLGGG